MADIADKSGIVFLVIDFDSSSNDVGVISVFLVKQMNNQLFWFLFFGLKNDQSKTIPFIVLN